MNRKFDTSDTSIVLPTPPRRAPGARTILFAGVAGACALGAGLGLWARPAMHERQAAAAPPPDAVAPEPAPQSARKLEIVVGDHPTPVGAPIEVLPASQQSAPVTALSSAPPPAAEPRRLPFPQALFHPPVGLIKAKAAEPVAAPEPPPAARPDPAPPPAEAKPAISLKAVIPVVAAGAVAVEKLVERAARSEPKHEVAEASPPPAPPVKAHRPPSTSKLELAKAEHAKAAKEAAREAARAAAREQAEAQAQADADARRVAAHAEAHRVELAREAKAEKAEQLRLARAEARAKAAQREEARLEALAEAAEAKKKTQLARLAHAIAHAVIPSHPKAEPQPVELVKLDRRHGRHGGGREAKVQQALLKRHAHEASAHMAAALHPRRIQPEPMAPQPANNGLVRISTPRCALRDPGEAIVCADPSLAAADHQLTRAYQGARAAGVPDAQLQRQQQRWLAARSAAAREAPWAVRDVYMARIAELNDQATEARSGY